MKTTNKTSRALIVGLAVLLTSLTSPFANAGNVKPLKKGSNPVTITDTEINSLLQHYSLEEDMPIVNITVMIYDQNDELVYSDVVCKKVYDCDERLNLLLNQSDFITEVDNTKIFKLNQ